MYDILIRGGRIVDGTGAPWFHADLGIVGERIATLGVLHACEGRVVISAEGRVVAPGFVDFHSHSDAALLADPRAQSAVRQGITTQLVGNCGFSAAPIDEKDRASFKRDGLMFSHPGGTSATLARLNDRRERAAIAREMEEGASGLHPDWADELIVPRPGGVIAAAWAVLNYLGREGYLRLVGQTMRYIRQFQADINATPGLEVLGSPVMTVFAYTSRTVDIFAVADGLEDRGWLVWRESVPFQAIRFMQSPGHEPFVATYVRDLRDVVQAVERGELHSRDRKANYT